MSVSSHHVVTLPALRTHAGLSWLTQPLCLPPVLLSLPSTMDSYAYATHVPQELVDMVVDHLHDDRASLASCCLVSKSWIDPSRHHLFQKVRVPGEENGKKSFEAFVNLLNQPTAVGKYIMDLELSSSASANDIFSLFKASPRPRLDSTMFTSILMKLTRLRSLAIDSISITAPSFAPSIFMPRKIALDRLTMTNVSVDRVATNMHVVLSLFSQVRTFRVQNPSTSFSPPTLSFGLTSLPPLPGFMAHDLSFPASPSSGGWQAPSQHLQVESLSLAVNLMGREVVTHIHRAIAFEHLQSFSASASETSELSLIGAFVLDAGQSLKHFEFNLRDRIVEDAPVLDNWRQLHLDACPSLQSVVLHLWLDGNDVVILHPIAMWHAALDLLFTVPSTVTEISFNIVFLGENETRALEMMDWDRFRQVMNRFPDLKRLEFYSYDERLEKFHRIVQTVGERRKAVIEEKLSDMHALGLVHVR